MSPWATRALEYLRVLDWLASLTSFSAGREAALALLPSVSLSEVLARLDATQEALSLHGARPGLNLGGARDVRPAVERALVGGLLDPEALLDIGSTLEAASRWQSGLARVAGAYPRFANLVDQLDPNLLLQAALNESIGRDGQVLDSASAELRRIRAEMHAAHERMLRRLNELVASSAFRAALQEPIVTQRDGRFVVPVKAEFRGQVRGIVHDQSASGATLFVEPLEVVELANRWRLRQREEEAEVERVLRALTAQVAESAGGLCRTVAALAEIDLNVAKARLAITLAATRPAMAGLPAPTDHPVLSLRESRHPLLERTLGRAAVVPISVVLGRGFDILLITGPNTGGKTVALKTVGLLALMAQAGMFIPAAEGSTLSVFGGIYADIGDEQSIEQSLSTFSSHVARLIQMLNFADQRSLVILDELGAGTDPVEGSALARALLEELRHRGVHCVASTHYSDLKVYASQTPRVENASAEFDLETLRPTYRLQIGLPGQSNALAIATRLGLPAQVVERARTLLDPSERDVAGMVERLHADLAAVAAERESASNARSEAEKLVLSRTEALREAEAIRQRAWQEARQESQDLLDELRRQAQTTLRQLERAGPSRADIQAAVEQTEKLQPIAVPESSEPAVEQPLLSSTPRVGATVFVPRLGVPGTVLAIGKSGELDVGVGGMRVQLALMEVQDGAQPSVSRRAEVVRDVSVYREARYVPLQLDVRGKRRDEAVAELDRYLHDAYLAGLPRVRVIHGRGTGAVRGAVRDLLGGHALVREFAAGARLEGGDGATIVALAV